MALILLILMMLFTVLVIVVSYAYPIAGMLFVILGAVCYFGILLTERKV
jgi:hypothetical protein